MAAAAGGLWLWLPLRLHRRQLSLLHTCLSPLLLLRLLQQSLPPLTLPLTPLLRLTPLLPPTPLLYHPLLLHLPMHHYPALLLLLLRPQLLGRGSGPPQLRSLQQELVLALAAAGLAH